LQFSLGAASPGTFGYTLVVSAYIKTEVHLIHVYLYLSGIVGLLRRRRELKNIAQEPMTKAKLSLHLTKHHAKHTYGGMEVYLHAFLTLAIEEGERSVSRIGSFTPGECAPVPIG
jgi:hypothetical protein